MSVLAWMGEHWFLSLVFGTFAFVLVHTLLSGFFRVLLGLVNRGAQPAPASDDEEEEEEQQEEELGTSTTEVGPAVKPPKRRSLWERLRDDDA